MGRRTRGEQRFAAITYSLLAEWTGLTLSTIRSYGSRGLIPRDNLENVVAWANARRQRRGLPMIGLPPPEIVEPDEISTVVIPPPSNYNPLTGSFDD